MPGPWVTQELEAEPVLEQVGRPQFSPEIEERFLHSLKETHLACGLVPQTLEGPF